MYCGPFLSVAYFDPRYYDLKVAYLTKIVGVHQSEQGCTKAVDN
jgi:hypothetical protein